MQSQDFTVFGEDGATVVHISTMISLLTPYKSHRYFKSKQTRGSGTQNSSNICNTHAALFLYISFDPASWMLVCNTIPISLLSLGGQTQILNGLTLWHLTHTCKVFISNFVLQYKSSTLCSWTTFGFGFYPVWPNKVTKKHPGKNGVLFVKSRSSIWLFKKLWLCSAVCQSLLENGGISWRSNLWSCVDIPQGNSELSFPDFQVALDSSSWNFCTF